MGASVTTGPEKPSSEEKRWADPEFERIVAEFMKKQTRPAESGSEQANWTSLDVSKDIKPIPPAGDSVIPNKALEAMKQYDSTIALNILDHYLQMGKPSVRSIYLTLPRTMTTLSVGKTDEINSDMASGLILSPMTGTRDLMDAFDLGEVEEMMISGSFGKALIESDEGYKVMVVLYQQGTLGLARLIASNVIAEVDRSARSFRP